MKAPASLAIDPVRRTIDAVWRIESPRLLSGIVARNRAIDELRRRRMQERKHDGLRLEPGPDAFEALSELESALGLTALKRAASVDGAPGSYRLQAEIAACHARARVASATDWARICALYEESCSN